MLAIVDYGVGNLFSLVSSFDAIGVKAEITKEPDKVRKADHVILPGVGAFRDAAAKLESCGMADLIKEIAKEGKPVMGICLGMQLLFEKSLEFGVYKGLGLVNGTVSPLEGVIDPSLKVPQMGWNALDIVKESPIFRYIKNGDYVYFVHSYYGTGCSDVIANCDYSIPVTAAVQRENVFGCQFHPEKSGTVGLNILKAFCEI